MNAQHPTGYWVQQLTDEDIERILQILVSKKKSKIFKKIIFIQRNSTEVIVTYESKRTNCYLTYAENHLQLSDYKVSIRNSYIDYFEFMVGKFGEDYVNDFLLFTKNHIANHPGDAWSKRYAKLDAAVPAMLDRYNHNLHNDI